MNTIKRRNSLHSFRFSFAPLLALFLIYVVLCFAWTRSGNISMFNFVYKTRFFASKSSEVCAVKSELLSLCFVSSICILRRTLVVLSSCFLSCFCQDHISGNTKFCLFVCFYLVSEGSFAPFSRCDHTS